MTHSGELGLTLLLFAVAWGSLAWPWLSGAVTIPWDAKAHFYPQLQFLAQSLHRGESPFWAPFVFAGHPQVADPQSLIVSPPYLLLAALNPDPSFRVADGVAFAVLGAGGVALILLFRDRGWHPVGAMVAALAFAFGASAAWRIQHIGQILSLGAWPIAYWLLLRALERRSGAYGLLAGLAAGVLALGRDQVAYLGLLILAGAAVAHLIDAPERWRESLKPLAVGALGGALVCAVPLTLTLLLAEVSNRSAIDYAGAARGSLHPALLLTAVIPHLFGVADPFVDYWGPPSPRWGPSDLVLARNMGVLYAGALPFLALLIAMITGVRARGVRYLAVALVLMTAYALGGFTPLFRLAHAALPGVDLFRRPADATFLVGALAAILAGYGAHRWMVGPLSLTGWRRLAVALVPAGCLAAGLALAIGKGTLTPAVGMALATAAASVVLAGLTLALLGRLRSRPRLALLAVTVMLGADLAWNNGPNESTALPPSTYEALRPGSADPLVQAIAARLRPDERVELAGLGFHWPNASLVHRWRHDLGYNPLRLDLYAAATGAGDHVALPDQRRFAPLFPSYRSALADLLGLRLIVTGVPIEQIDPALRPGDLAPLGTVGGAYLYENPRARPRASFVGEAATVDFAAMVRDGRWPEVDLASTVLLERPGPASSSGSRGSVRVIEDGTTEIVLAVEADGPGYVVLNDVFHPWWFATVDGRPADVLRANVLFRAVPVPAGAREVRLTFRPFAGAWRQIASKR